MAVDLVNSYPLPGLIENAPLKTSKTYPVSDPHSGKLIHEAYAVDVEDATRAVEAAAKAFPAWKGTPVLQRRAIFMKVAELIEQRKAQIVEIDTTETTSSAVMSGFTHGLGLAHLQELAGVVTVALRGETAPETEGQRAYILREPYGVVFSIAPWNAPFVLGLRAVADPIIAGNSCVLKTSEFSPRVHNAIGQLFLDAGLPSGVLNIIHVDPKDAPKVAEAVIAHPAVWKVNFTGSTRVGAIIAQYCGKHLKPVVLELGGAAPLIVRADADLEHAVNCAIHSGLLHSGQICMSLNTLVVHESVADQFTSILASQLNNAKYAAGAGERYKGLFTSASAERVDGLIKDAQEKGAVIAAGKYDVQSNVVQPVVLSNITTDMRIFYEEIFGPAFGIVRFKDDNEAVELANKREYGLAASIYSKDTEVALQMARKIDSGMVHINSSPIHDPPHLPHGGWKKSGWGRFSGIEGIREFTQIKVITVNDLHMYPL